MPSQIYFKAKRRNSSIGLKIFWTLFLIALLCFSSSAFAGYPIGGKSGIEVYNVKNGGFSVVWQVDVASTSCSVKLYDENGILIPTENYTVHSGETASQQLGLTRGVMQVDVRDLPTDVATYYIQTVSTDDPQVPEKYLFPEVGDLIPVITEPFFTGTVSYNGLLFLILYDENGINAGDYQENMIADGAVAIVYAETADKTQSAHYPIGTFDAGTGLNNGFPQSVTENRIDLDLGYFRTGPRIFEQNNYWIWTAGRVYSLTIKCFGGGVPNVGKGQSTIKTTFIGLAAPTCLDNFDGCADVGGVSYNQIILRPNQPPVCTLSTRDEDDPFDSSIPAYVADPTVSIEACADDPEGDPMTFSLVDAPGGIQLEPAIDTNCRIISGAPTAGGGFYRNIQFTVSDGTSECSETFTIIRRNGPPLPPTIDSPVSPSTVFTNEGLTCTVNSSSIINPDPEDTIYLDYRWYNASDTPPSLVYEELSTTGQYQSQLSSGITQKGGEYYCEVTVRDDDGSAEPRESARITVANSPAAAPDNVIITPGDAAQPKTDANLECTASYTTTTPDLDDDIVYFKFNWTTVGGKQYESTGGNSGFLNTNTHQLPSSETAKGDVWKCTVIAWDVEGAPPGATSANSRESSTVTIRNTPPATPAGASIAPSDPNTTHDLICTVMPASPTDVDQGDVGNIQYEFTWSCNACDDDDFVNMRPAGTTTDTLSKDYTDKDEVWSCEVSAFDGTDYSPESVSASPVTIQNSPPVGLSAEVTPDPNAYVDQELSCAATGVTDADGDVISYSYSWREDGVEVIFHDFQEGKTTDTLDPNNTSQDETWDCEVTAKDTSDASISATSNQVYIYNRAPIIITDPTAEPHIWEENGYHEIEISASDPDGNGFTLEIDTNYIKPNDLDWLEFDANDTHITIKATPPDESSSLDVDYGPGILKFNFIVTETDGIPPRQVEKTVTVKIRVPCTIVDDFEYEQNAPTLGDNGWYKLQGSGDMLLKQEDPNDPNSNHYLQTTLTTTPTNNSQINLIIYKTISTSLSSVYNNQYPRIQFSVTDKNLYYFDAFVRGKSTTGSEGNYFLRYIPQDPNDVGWEYKVSGNYVRYNIGPDSIDPNGRVVTEISRDMDGDLFNATGFHYLYLKGIVIRGDIDYLDDIQVCSGGLIPPLMDVENLTAQGNENQVTLQWTLPEDQTENIAGYNIYMKEGAPPTKGDYDKKITKAPDKTSHTETGLTTNVTYYFLMSAFDDFSDPNETVGKAVSTTTPVTIPFAPDDLEATSKDSTIQLTWMNPPNQHKDLAGYTVYYCDCVFGDCNDCHAEMITADKADAAGLFVHTINKDASGNPLVFDESYSFTVKAKDTADPPNFSAVSVDERVSITLTPLATKLIDNFDSDYGPTDTLIRKGWYRLQGKGKYSRKVDGLDMYYLEKIGPSDHIVVKWLTDPEDFTNPYFSADVRSLGDFRIDVYLKGKDMKNYFLSYKGNKNTDEDSATPDVEQTRFFVYTIGWQTNGANSTKFYPIERNLDDDLMAANGVQFDMVLGILLRGTLDIDNLELGEGVLDVENLTLRAGPTYMSLSWTVADPNKIDETRIYVNDSMIEDPNIVMIDPTKNDYKYIVDNLTPDTEYEFKIVQVTEEEEESKGVEVTAKTMEYKAGPFTFDDESALTEWPLSTTVGVNSSVVYDSGVQSNVMHINPTGDYPDRYYAANENINVSDVTGMICRIKPISNFVIWVDIEAPAGAPFMLGFVPGGTKGDHLRFGSFAYYYLGPGYTDGKWHYLDLNLDDKMGIILPGIVTDAVNGIYIGGEIYVDDVSVY